MQLSRQSVVVPFPGPDASPSVRHERLPLGEVLVRSGALNPDDLIKALAIQQREDASLGNILLNHTMISEADLFGALSTQFDADLVDLVTNPPDPRLMDGMDIDQCIREGFLPWKHVGCAMVIVTSRPDQFTRLRRELPSDIGPLRMAIAPEHDIQCALISLCKDTLIARAETKTAPAQSCRSWNPARLARFTLAAVLTFISCALLAPAASFTVLCGWAVLTLIMNTGLKLATAISQYRHRMQQNQPGLKAPKPTEMMRLPVVSIMVPLFREREVAGHLIRRLKRLNYPKELLDICLVVESDDDTTRDTLRHTHLPRWVRVIKVPHGTLRTKPRAMNFALDFCRGSIIGVYDAEDAPHPDQIHTVVRRFHERDAQVACLQGVLDFYNARTNWLSRCFTVEYATWFRVFLPGLERLGFAVPLGGTTLFFRRAALEELGGWDAHNVTEDADLGIRLARYGYRTEIIETVTEEEANCRALPWVKQRSRWLKGFAITWAVHMRAPRKLLQELGFLKFLGVQILFLGTLSQFLLAPVLWSFWLIPFGVAHPLLAVVHSNVLIALMAVFLIAEVITIAVGAFAVSDKKHRFLTLWVPTMHFYFPLGTFAAYKAMYELMTNPFYWDKTTHGVFERTEKRDQRQGSALT